MSGNAMSSALDAPRTTADAADVCTRAASRLGFAVLVAAVAVVWPVAELTRFLLERTMCRAR